jgi:predicted DNA-binding protein (UPF0251 family)
MPRPEKKKIVHTPPFFTEFKPIGVQSKLLTQNFLSLDEYEAFRLADYVGLSHEEASDEMEISRSTFTRLIEKARRKIAVFLVKGQLLKIEGGNIHFKNNIIRCLDCGYMFEIDMGTSFLECPECKSKNLLNLAGGFGHGKCCTKENRNKRSYHAGKRQNDL